MKLRESRQWLLSAQRLTQRTPRKNVLYYWSSTGTWIYHNGTASLAESNIYPDWSVPLLRNWWSGLHSLCSLFSTEPKGGAERKLRAGSRWEFVIVGVRLWRQQPAAVRRIFICRVHWLVRLLITDLPLSPPTPGLLSGSALCSPQRVELLGRWGNRGRLVRAHPAFPLCCTDTEMTFRLDF